MKVVTTLDEVQVERKELKEPVGLVPTMGALHEGHLSLVRQAKQDCPSVVVSIFVNPSQFGPEEDLKRYPRDLQRDLDLLAPLGVDLVWTPTVEVMYLHGYQTWVTVEEVTRRLEGEMRPGHFKGVATVVTKLFNAVRPQRAYFGQKDAQQLAVVRRMVKDLNFPIEVVACPTVREPDGLAMSSRNVYLTKDERRAATTLSRALFRAKDAFDSGERDADVLREIVKAVLAGEPALHVQYVSCADPETLLEQAGKVDQSVLSLAATIGKTHLIDNILLKSK